MRSSPASAGALSARSWDAIVVGASFGGLAAAVELAGAGRVLLIDRAEIGDAETSACGTPPSVLARLQAMAALEQVHEEIVVHLPTGRTKALRPRYPFVTFSYRRLCALLYERTDAHFLQGGVISVAARAYLQLAGVRPEGGDEDVGLASVGAGDGDGAGGSNAEAAAPAGVQQPSEDRRAIEMRPAQPIDRAIRGDERRGMRIADEGVVADRSIAFRGAEIHHYRLRRREA